MPNIQSYFGTSLYTVDIANTYKENKQSMDVYVRSHQVRPLGPFHRAVCIALIASMDARSNLPVVYRHLLTNLHVDRAPYRVPMCYVRRTDIPPERMHAFVRDRELGIISQRQQ
jgi:hypothetical protein